jgi:hypothetical protein
VTLENPQNIATGKSQSSGYFTAFAMIVAAVCIGYAVNSDGGDYSRNALLWITVAGFFAILPVVLPAFRGLEEFSQRYMLFVLVAALAIQASLILNELKTDSQVELGIGVIAFLGMAQAMGLDRLRMPVIFIMMLSFCLLGSIAFRVHARDPGIDVAIFQQDAAEGLLHGKNPYEMRFPNIYPPITGFYGPGVVDEGRIFTDGIRSAMSNVIARHDEHVKNDLRLSLAERSAELADTEFLRKEMLKTWIPVSEIVDIFDRVAKRHDLYIANDLMLSREQKTWEILESMLCGRSVKLGTVMYGFPYPPLSLLMVLPGYILGGDVRYADVVAMALSAMLMAGARPGRWSALAATLFLLTPKAVYVLDLAWTEPMLALNFSIAMFCACRWKKALPYALGIFFATKQYTVLALPALILFVDGPNPWKQLWDLVWKAGLVVAAITVPFFLWNPHEFIRSVVLWQLVQPFRRDALSYLVFFYRHNGQRILPVWTPFLAVIPAMRLSAWRFRRSPAGFAAAVTLINLAFFAFNKQAFCNYYYFVIATACWVVAATADPEAETASDPRRGFEVMEAKAEMQP